MSAVRDLEKNQQPAADAAHVGRICGAIKGVAELLVFVDDDSPPGTCDNAADAIVLLAEVAHKMAEDIERHLWCAEPTVSR